MVYLIINGEITVCKLWFTVLASNLHGEWVPIHTTLDLGLDYVDGSHRH